MYHYVLYLLHCIKKRIEREFISLKFVEIGILNGTPIEMENDAQSCWNTNGNAECWPMNDVFSVMYLAVKN